MNNYLKAKILLVAIFLCGSQAMAQEICNNSIDDDGDAKIDCFDPDCSLSPDCSGFFVGDQPACEVEPDSFPTFSLSLEWASPNRTVSNLWRPSIGDLDGDGIPEVVSGNESDNMLYVLSGVDGTIKFQRNVGDTPLRDVAIADVDDDGFVEIFQPLTSPYSVAAYNFDLSAELWRTNTTYKPGLIGIADFDEDGFPEIYAKDEIIDALSGTMMHASQFINNSGSLPTTYPEVGTHIEANMANAPVAVDVLADGECANCAGLELVIGGFVYSVSINRPALTASLNLERSFNYLPQFITGWNENRSSSSIADFNEDGFLDVIKTGVDPTIAGDSTRVFFWDLQTNIVLNYTDPANFWDKGTGRLNIADVDGDGGLNVTYVSGNRLYALDSLWETVVG